MKENTSLHEKCEGRGFETYLSKKNKFWGHYWTNTFADKFPRIEKSRQNNLDWICYPLVVHLQHNWKIHLSTVTKYLHHRCVHLIHFSLHLPLEYIHCSRGSAESTTPRLVWRLPSSRLNPPHAACNYGSRYRLGGPHTRKQCERASPPSCCLSRPPDPQTTLIHESDVTKQRLSKCGLWATMRMFLSGMFLLRVIQVISGSSFCVSGSAETVRGGLRSTCARTCGIDILWSTNMKHQSISRWLSQLGLPQYCLVLEQEYDGVEVKLEKKKKNYTNWWKLRTFI